MCKNLPDIITCSEIYLSSLYGVVYIGGYSSAYGVTYIFSRSTDLHVENTL